MQTQPLNTYQSTLHLVLGALEMCCQLTTTDVLLFDIIRTVTSGTVIFMWLCEYIYAGQVTKSTICSNKHFTYLIWLTRKKHNNKKVGLEYKKIEIGRNPASRVRKLPWGHQVGWDASKLQRSVNDYTTGGVGQISSTLLQLDTTGNWIRPMCVTRTGHGALLNTLGEVHSEEDISSTYNGY